MVRFYSCNSSLYWIIWHALHFVSAFSAWMDLQCFNDTKPWIASPSTSKSGWMLSQMVRVQAYFFLVLVEQKYTKSIRHVSSLSSVGSCLNIQATPYTCEWKFGNIVPSCSNIFFKKNWGTPVGPGSMAHAHAFKITGTDPSTSQSWIPGGSSDSTSCIGRGWIRKSLLAPRKSTYTGRPTSKWSTSTTFWITKV